MKCYIARDIDNCLWLFRNRKPTKNKYGYYITKYMDCMELDNTWFPEVTFANSPQEVELKLVEK